MSEIQTKTVHVFQFEHVGEVTRGIRYEDGYWYRDRHGGNHHVRDVDLERRGLVPTRTFEKIIRVGVRPAGPLPLRCVDCRRDIQFDWSKKEKTSFKCAACRAADDVGRFLDEEDALDYLPF